MMTNHDDARPWHEVLAFWFPEGRVPDIASERHTEHWCRIALKWGHPQFVWCRGSIRALSKFGPARPYIARFKVFNRLIWPSA